ncbi:hypothetical protein F0562_032597 [Nyssa sinensis]|uniref:CCHC-type domain-containing protein n=1 Tax=Nyssa sinensis TaxID=561372 RepID=A0A5J5AT53_9ASTE|nr:hypothetical protein F0562_032597 [Nyssa sinensis]
MENNSTTPNPTYNIWVRQDQLILNALIGSLSPTIILFIARAKTSQEAWTILANTYAKPSRGCIKQVKTLFKNSTKGTLTIIDFLQSVKARADELSTLGAPIDEEDLTKKILDGLGDDYKELVHVVQACDNPISFDELHEKLLTFEASLQGKTKELAHFPATANPTNRTNTNWRPQNTNNNWRPNPHGHTGWRSSPNSYTHPPMTSNSGTPPRDNHPLPRPYLGHCQICGIQGHTAKQCLSFQLVPIQPSNKDSTPPTSTQSTPWQPRAHFAANVASNNPAWLLDSGASHHVTTDLSGCVIHRLRPYSSHKLDAHSKPCIFLGY